jgi:hypothetical protein
VSASFLALAVTRTPEGGLEVALRYSYERRPPSSRKRVEMARGVLRETLERLGEGEPVDLGFAEDAHRRVRTDKMEA